MSTLSPVVISLIHRQVGHITSRQLSEAGVGRTARQHLVAKGVLAHVHKSVYRLVSAEVTFEQRLIALSLAHPAGFITGPTLGGYVGLRKMPKASAINLCLPHGHVVDIGAGVRLRQSTQVTSEDHRRLENGMVVASWPRLLFDLAADLRPRPFASVLEQVVDQGHCSLEDLGAAARRLCHPARAGSVLFAGTLVQRGERAAVQSDPELTVLEGLLARGVPVVAQHDQLQLPNGRRVRIDLAVPDIRWAVEIDVHPSHLRPDGVTRDHRRDRQLHLVDWQVEHVTELDLIDRERVLDELAELYRRRAAARAA